MTNAQGLYYGIAIVFIAAFVTATLVIRRNKDDDYNQDSPERAARSSKLGMLFYPLFIVLGIVFIVFIMVYHSR